MTETPAARHHLEQQAGSLTTGTHIVLPDGFIWTKGECGVGSFTMQAEGLSLSFEDSNWIRYEFDWSNK